MQVPTIFTLLASLLVGPSLGCGTSEEIRSDVRVRTVSKRPQIRSSATGKIVIENVRVFDGNSIGSLSSVVIEGNLIGSDPAGATETIDGQGGVIIPGLIESHSHPETLDDLHELTRYGVTTAFSLSCHILEECPSLKNQHGLVDVRISTTPAASPGSSIGNLTMSKNPDPSHLVYNSTDAARWIQDQLEVNPDFVKLSAQTPGLSQGTLNILTGETHRAGKLAVCHAADLAAHQTAVLAGVDQIHHATADFAADARLAAQVSQRGQVFVPTLSILKALAETDQTGIRNFTASLETVRLYREAGVPILAGSDANYAIAAAPFGRALHNELAVLVEAGLTTEEVLGAATSTAAEHWGLQDRGEVVPGKRADLVLIDGDPLANISATRNIKRVWVAGIEYPLE